MPQVVKLPKTVLNRRPMDFRYVEYDYASYIVQKLGIKSFRQYRKWVKEYHPGGFPTAPERVYHEWKSWNDFLNVDNGYLGTAEDSVSSFELLPYWEAVNVIQPLQFKTMDEYLNAWDDGKIPGGIPRRPDMRYQNFTKNGGWSIFLGKTISNRVQASQNTEPLLALCSTVGQSPNVLTLVISKKGPRDLSEILKGAPHLKTVQIFHWDDSVMQSFHNLLNYYGTQQSDNAWMFSNVHDILFELSNLLDTFMPQ